MGKFIPTGMRTKITDENAMIINTCAGNDTAEAGDATRWTWSNPTNRRFQPEYHGRKAASTECLWQGTKIRGEADEPDEETMAGAWRRGKGKKPRGAWAGPGKPLITSPGEARRAIYIPAFRRQIEGWMAESEQVRAWVQAARDHDGPVYLRDHDTGQGIDRNGPMSHAWVLATWLNTGEWPGA